MTDNVPRGRIVTLENLTKSEVESSRLRLGPLRIIPSFTIRSAGYDSNVLGTPEVCPSPNGCEPKTGDWMADVSAGARAILPIGSKMYLRGEAFPSYTWYQETERRRKVGGFYSGSLLAYFNRMSVEARGYETRGLGFLNSETETRILQRTTSGSLGIELDLGRALSLYTQAEAQEHRLEFIEEPAIPDIEGGTLDRDEGAARGGIRYRVSPHWELFGGLELTRTEFEVNPQRRNNESIAYQGGIHYNQPKFYANLSAALREGSAYGGSSFPDYSTATGSYFVSYFPARRIELQGYGRRGIAYSTVDPNSPYYVETRNGAGLNIEVHRRLLFRGFATYGTNDHPFRNPAFDQEDRVTSYGGGLSALLTRKLVVTGLVTRDDWESEFPGIRRSVVRFSTGLSFEGVFAR